MKNSNFTFKKNKRKKMVKLSITNNREHTHTSLKV